MPEVRARVAGERSPQSACEQRYEYCLYLLAEAERMIDQTAGEWSALASDLIRARLVQLGDKLTHTTTGRQ